MERNPACDPDPPWDESFVRSPPCVWVAVLALGTLAIHVISSLSGTTWMWGAHFYRFFPISFLYVATILVASATLALILHAHRSARGMISPSSSHRRGWKHRTTIIASVGIGTCLLWLCRICHQYLGDGAVIVQEVGSYHHVLEREPLTSLLQYGIYGVARPWFVTAAKSPEAVAHDAVALGSVAAGFLFLINAWILAAELSRIGQPPGTERRASMLLFWLILVTQGYVQLFFGYVENYAFQAVGIVLFLGASLRYLRGACALIWPAFSLCVCIALHLSSLLLTIPFLVLVIAGLRLPDRRRAALRDLFISALVIAGFALLASRQYDPLATLVNMFQTAFADHQDPGYLFSRAHVRDFFNEQLLIGPLGMFLFLGIAGCAVVRLRKNCTPVTMFALVAGITYVASSWMFKDSNLGYARDWDLLSHSSIILTTAGLVLLARARPSRTALRASLMIAVLISAYHTVPWIATNALRPQSLARLETLPLGLGRTEVMLATWYAEINDESTERAWLQRAVIVYPGNASAYYLLGVLDMKHVAYNSAINSFRHMVAIRPDKVAFRGELARAYFLANRFSEAAPDLEFIVDRDPSNTMAVFYLGESLTQAGRSDEATEMFIRAENMCRDAVETRPDDSRAAAAYGWVQFRLGCADEALATLGRAITLIPPSPVANCYLGYVLHSMERDDEARDHFVTCLETDPEVPERDQIEEWLSGITPLLHDR